VVSRYPQGNGGVIRTASTTGSLGKNKRRADMFMNLFTGTKDDFVITSFYGMAPPPADAIARREARIEEVKERFADKMRCALSVGKLEKPL
jgi:hypothetical protein